MAYKMKGFSGFGNSPLQQKGHYTHEGVSYNRKTFREDPRYKLAKAEWDKFGMGTTGPEYYEEMNRPVKKGGKTTTGTKIKGTDMGKGYTDVRSTPKKVWDKLTQYGQGLKGAFTKGQTAKGEYQREKTHDKIAGLAKTGGTLPKYEQSWTKGGKPLHEKWVNKGGKAAYIKAAKKYNLETRGYK